jgi:hypothetical protein
MIAFDGGEKLRVSSTTALKLAKTPVIIVAGKLREINRGR